MISTWPPLQPKPWCKGNCWHACPIDQLLSNSRATVQLLGVKAAQMASLGGRLTSQDTAPFLHGSINRCSYRKLVHFATYFTTTVHKPSRPCFKPGKAVSLSMPLLPGEECACRDHTRKRVFTLLHVWVISTTLTGLISIQDAFNLSKKMCNVLMHIVSRTQGLKKHKPLYLFIY